MSVSGSSRARRISPAASRAREQAQERREEVEPVVGPAFATVCATVLLSALLMAIILAMRTHGPGPVPAYALFGSGLFASVFAAFLMGAVHLAVTDSRRHKDHDHQSHDH